MFVQVDLSEVFAHRETKNLQRAAVATAETETSGRSMPVPPKRVKGTGNRLSAFKSARRDVNVSISSSRVSSDLQLDRERRGSAGSLSKIDIEAATASRQKGSRLKGGVFGQGAAIRSTENFVPEPPHDDAIRKSGILQKRVVGAEIYWSDRYVTLTGEKIYIRNSREGPIREEIDVIDITYAQVKVEHEHANADGDHQNSPGPHSMRAGSMNRLADIQWENVLEIYVESIGRTFYLRASREVECEDWVGAVNQAIKDAHAEEERQIQARLGFFEKHRLDIQHFYDHSTTQTCLALVLLINFVISIWESDNPQNITKHDKHRLDMLEIAFTVIYALELAINMIGHWFRPFFQSAWNWFDLIIVSLSFYDMGYVLSGGNGSGLNVLRLLRILRVVRIFNKLENMRRILKARCARVAIVCVCACLPACVCGERGW